MTPLVIPPAAQRDERSIQMLSAWIAERGFHCTLNIGFFDGQGHNEAEAWGVLLADLVRHIGNAWAEKGGDRQPRQSKLSWHRSITSWMCPPQTLSVSFMSGTRSLGVTLKPPVLG